MILPAQIDIGGNMDGQIYLTVRPLDETQQPINVPITRDQAHRIIVDARTAISLFRPDYEDAYIKEAKRYAKEGFLEIDNNAIVSYEDEHEGAYVETWHWIDAEEALAEPPLASAAV